LKGASTRCRKFENIRATWGSSALARAARDKRKSSMPVRDGWRLASPNSAKDFCKCRPYLTEFNLLPECSQLISTQYSVTSNEKNHNKMIVDNCSYLSRPISTHPSFRPSISHSTSNPVYILLSLSFALCLASSDVLGLFNVALREATGDVVGVLVTVGAGCALDHSAVAGVLENLPRVLLGLLRSVCNMLVACL